MKLKSNGRTRSTALTIVTGASSKKRPFFPIIVANGRQELSVLDVTGAAINAHGYYYSTPASEPRCIFRYYHGARKSRVVRRRHCAGRFIVRTTVRSEYSTLRTECDTIQAEFVACFTTPALTVAGLEIIRRRGPPDIAMLVFFFGEGFPADPIHISRTAQLPRTRSRTQELGCRSRNRNTYKKKAN